MADQQESPSGLVITDDAGNYYYLRSEILEQARMPDEDVQKLKSGMAAASPGSNDELSSEALDAVAGGGMMGGIGGLPGIANIPQLNPNALKTAASLKGGKFDLSKVSYSTVMCPW
ncbi:MAG: hypothetical protein K2X71_10075 [Methylobacterium sp.]|uniref:hypothetical protein n=1 Tax=Methylobacterium sp. TaxID=409 RepID=UPI00258A58F9|nr:hypothetical protein [Methylobacterium sp.]MBY0296371.1 hypothetical protein [Methylobacterium sp.]